MDQSASHDKASMLPYSSNFLGVEMLKPAKIGCPSSSVKSRDVQLPAFRVSAFLLQYVPKKSKRRLVRRGSRASKFGKLAACFWPH